MTNGKALYVFCMFFWQIYVVKFFALPLNVGVRIQIRQQIKLDLSGTGGNLLRKTGTEPKQLGFARLQFQNVSWF